MLQDHSGDSQTTVPTSCNQLETSWTCSNGYNNLSLCASFCSDGELMEYKRCSCKENICFWVQKGEPCATETRDDSNISEQSSQTGNLSLPINSDADLISAIREMHLTNNGVMNVSFNLKSKI